MSAPIPAFPRTGEGFGNPRYDAPGMELRDWFAGKALGGLLANPKLAPTILANGGAEGRWIEESAFAFADALMAERDKREAPVNRADKLKLVLLQYRNDMLYPPDADSRGRRIAMVDATLANLGIDAS